MLDLILWLTCLPVPLTIFMAYRRTRDPLHPIMYLGPMIFYVYAFVPLLLYYRGLVSPRFPEESDVVFAQTFIGLAMASFCVGVLYHRVRPAALRSKQPRLDFSPRVRKRLRVLSYLLGVVGVCMFLYMLSLRGGLFRVYRFSKGGVGGVSGYMTSAPFLCMPAIMLYLLSRQGHRKRLKDVLVVLTFVSPQLVHGLLGASRGTIFLALGTLAFGWYLTAPERPPLRTVMAVVVAIGVLMIFLKSQRKEIYIGSDLQFSRQTFLETLFPSTDAEADQTSYTWGSILVSRRYEIHGWGRHYLIHLLIRPIPREWWPTKYEDSYAIMFGVTDTDPDAERLEQWQRTVGWLPTLGSATGFIADSFVEFAWGGLIVCYLMGFFYGYLWRQAVLRSGIWSVLYFEACVVSVYLPTQGLASAWGFRFVYIAVPIILLWRYLVSPLAGASGRLPVDVMQRSPNHRSTPRSVTPEPNGSTP